MKINCESVGFKNFLSFGSKWQDIPLKTGLNFVTGWDAARNKSNGAGKSSFLESIIFALFGKTARDIKKEQIVNWKNKKQCEVVFRFGINDNKYEVMRAIKPDKLEIYRNGSLLDQTAHVKDYQSMFEDDIFGMDLKMFTSLVHSNSNSSANILSMKKPEKRKLMERMFDLTIFSKMNEICNEKLRNIESRLRETEIKIQSQIDQAEKAKQMIARYEDEIKQKARIEKELAELQAEFTELVEDNPNLEEEIEKLSEQIAKKEESLRNKIQLVEKKETEVQTKISRIEEDIAKAKSLEDIIANNLRIEKEIKEMEEEHGTPDQLTEEHNKLKDVKAKQTSLKQKLLDEHHEIDKEITELKTDKRNLEKNLDLLKEGVCPVCGTEVKDPKAHYGKEIGSCKRKITNRTKKLESLHEQISKIDEELNNIDSSLEVVQELKDTMLKLRVKIEKVTETDTSDLYDQLSGFRQSMEILEKKKTELKNKTGEEVTPIHNKWKELKVDLAEIKAKKKEVETLETQVKVEKKNIDSFKDMIEEQKSQISAFAEKAEELKESMTKHLTLKDYLKSIKGLLKDEMIKQHMISKIMPYLNQQANYYLSEVDYAFYVAIDRWLDIKIKGPGITKATYDSLSGGERRGIDLAIQLGFLDIARTQAGIFPDLLTFDELLDSSIDGQGIGEVLKIVRVKQREANGKFFIISHRSEIDTELIDHQYHVIKENGYSRVEV